MTPPLFLDLVVICVICEICGFKSRRSWHLGGSDTRLLGQLKRLSYQFSHETVKIAKALIMRLTLHVAKIDLLNHYRNLEAREGFVEGDAREIATGLRFIPHNDLITRHPARPIRNRTQ